MVSLRLFLAEEWTSDSERMARARVPEEGWTVRTKLEIAIEEIDLWRDNLGENGASIWMRRGSRVWG